MARRTLNIRVALEPTRIGSEPLRMAYQVVLPERRVEVGEAPKQMATARPNTRVKGMAE